MIYQQDERFIRRLREAAGFKDAGQSLAGRIIPASSIFVSEERKEKRIVEAEKRER
jgi:hypothetical protein